MILTAIVCNTSPSSDDTHKCSYMCFPSMTEDLTWKFVFLNIITVLNVNTKNLKISKSTLTKP